MNDMMNPTPPEINDDDYALLSAYIDNQISDSERQALEVRLADDKVLQTELIALRQTVQWLNALPQLKAPRDFTLTEADVAHLPKPTIQLMPRRNPIIWLASAAAIIVVVIGFGVFLSSTPNGDASSAPEPMAQEVAALPTNLASESQAAQRELNLTSVQQSPADASVPLQSQGGLPLEAPELAITDEEAADNAIAPSVSAMQTSDTTETFGLIAPIVEEEAEANIMNEPIEDGIGTASQADTGNTNNLQGAGGEAIPGEQALPNSSVTAFALPTMTASTDVAQAMLAVPPSAPASDIDQNNNAAETGIYNEASQKSRFSLLPIIDTLRTINFRNTVIRIVLIVLGLAFP